MSSGFRRRRGRCGLGDLQLEQVVAAVRHAEVVNAGGIHGEIGDVEGILDGFDLGLDEHFARVAVEGELPAVAAGDPPETDGCCALGLKADGVDHALVRLGLAAEVEALGGGVAVVEGLVGAVDLVLRGVHHGEVVLEGLAVAVRLLALRHSGQVEGGVQDVALLGQRARQGQRQHAEQQHEEGESFDPLSGHCICLL